MKTLSLFNAVLLKNTPANQKPLFLEIEGCIIEPGALWAKDSIIQYLTDKRLSGQDLNKGFYRSWSKVISTPDRDKVIDQVNHYLSTYGSEFKKEIVLPISTDDFVTEDFTEEELKSFKLECRVIKAYPKEELVEMCLDLLKSGLALKQETLLDLFEILEDLDYTFSSSKGIKNKEALSILADKYGVMPEDPVDFLRYLVYLVTGETLLIKNVKSIKGIKTGLLESEETVEKVRLCLESFDFIKLSTIFNRFKPLFLSFKPQFSKEINKISKLSKTHHRPLPENVLNKVTSRLLTEEDMHWVENATIFSLLKALNACNLITRGQVDFLYKIRNGKAFAKSYEKINTKKMKICKDNLVILIKYLKSKLDLTGKEFYIPKFIEYGLPTSEKQFVGNLPMGTSLNLRDLIVGVYWKEDEEGARDLDLSLTAIGHKIGWNAKYSHSDTYYSGDITSAPNGAVEYVKFLQPDPLNPYLVNLNVFSKEEGPKFKILVGSSGESIPSGDLMQPKNLMIEVDTTALKKESILGMVTAEKEGGKSKITLYQLAIGNNLSSSYDSEISRISNSALYHEISNSLKLEDLIKFLGGTVIKTREEFEELKDLKTSESFNLDSMIDLSLNKVSKETFLDLFKPRDI
jgi:hypothetical protein